MNMGRKSTTYILISMLMLFLLSGAYPDNIVDSIDEDTVTVIELTCMICAESSEQVVLTNFSLCGPGDLDGRQSLDRPGVLGNWINRCPNCGYCAVYIEVLPIGLNAPPITIYQIVLSDEYQNQQNISEFAELTFGDAETIRQIIESVEYQDQLVNSNFPELANSYICQSLIEEELGNDYLAGWTSLSAAWACDDEEGYEESAIECRLRAIELLESFPLERRPLNSLFQLQDETPANSSPSHSIRPHFMVDLYRRIGEFDRAMEVCNAALSELGTEIAYQSEIDSLTCERKLINEGNTDAHSHEPFGGCQYFP